MVDYVKIAKRDSQLINNEVDKMNGILFDIKKKKKYEEELKNRFSDVANTPASAEEIKEDQAAPEDLGTRTAVQLNYENAEISNSKIFEGKRVRNDTEILSEAIKEHQ